MSISYRAALAALALCAGLSVGSTVIAAPASPYDDGNDQIVRKIAYGDADLHTEAGAASLAHRVRTAADYVCGGGDILVRQSASFERCRHAAIDRAIARLNAPMVARALGHPASALANR